MLSEKSPTLAANKKVASPKARLSGLDSIRFICALAVVIQHSGLTEPFGIDLGAPAVLIFFVLSGFCIHYSSVEKARLDLLVYYPRRHLRIGIPCFSAILMGPLLGYGYLPISASVLWTLLCEELYYAFYPLLHQTSQKLGWKPLLGGSYVLSIALLSSLSPARLICLNSAGSLLNWLVFAPAWLLGCLLAQHIADQRQSASPFVRNAPSRPIVCTLRTAVVAASCLMGPIYHHFGIPIAWQSYPFALLTFAWLFQEIPFALEHSPVRWLEKCGAFSYSLYLIHWPIAMWLLKTALPWIGSYSPWVAAGVSAACIPLSFAFYLLVERPSHKLARAWLRSRDATKPSAARNPSLITG